MYVFSYFPFGFEGRIWDLIVSVPDHCLSFYFDITYMYVLPEFQLHDRIIKQCKKLSNM